MTKLKKWYKNIVARLYSIVKYFPTVVAIEPSEINPPRRKRKSIITTKESLHQDRMMIEQDMVNVMKDFKNVTNDLSNVVNRVERK